MKKKAVFLFLLSMIMPNLSFSQNAKVYEHTHRRASENTKVSKEARKEARRLKSLGYETPNGKITIEQQLDQVWGLEKMQTDRGPRYHIVQSTLVADNPFKSRYEAITKAKCEIVELVEMDLHHLLDHKIEKEELNSNHAHLLKSLITKNRPYISMRLGQVIPVLEIYRKLPGQELIETHIRMICEVEDVIRLIKEIIRPELMSYERELGDTLIRII